MTKKEQRKRGRPTKSLPEMGVVSLGGRVSAEIKRRLDESARRNGRTLSRELEVRLAQSFEMDDRAGDASLAPIANLTAGAFALGGRRQAEAEGHPGWTPTEWMRNERCYAAATLAVVFALSKHAPDMDFTSAMTDFFKLMREAPAGPDEDLSIEEDVA